MWGVFVGVVIIGALAAWHYAQRELTLSHYDARAHLVVARRVLDSLTPGWRQIGAVWLPLPHLINLLPVQIDWNYRTGYLTVALSVLALATGLAALSRFLHRRTGSAAVAVAGPAFVILNPNVLYLQSTPMTEPLLFGLSFLALERVDAWITTPSRMHRITAGWTLAALALTRYEGWAIAAALIAIAALSQARRRWHALALLPYFLGAIAAFLLLGRYSTGRWFVSSGFFVPDNPAQGRPFAVLGQILQATRDLGGDTLVVGALVGVVICLVGARRYAPSLLPLALAASAALPLWAFYNGHPHRVRYMVPLVAAGGVLLALAVSRLPRRAHAWAAVGLMAVMFTEHPPFEQSAPMVTEAQWETPYRLGREAVSAYFDRAYDQTPVLASMGSLGHYMQEASRHGLRIEQFVHEGNGNLWSESVASPARHVGWILIEEQAEGGDVLAVRARTDPHFLEGFVRVAEGGGVGVYKKR